VKPERIHGIQRIPHRRERGYCNKNPHTARAKALGRPGPGDPGWQMLLDAIPEAERCPGCKGHGFAPDEQVNRHRTHFMRHVVCEACGGSGRRSAA